MNAQCTVVRKRPSPDAVPLTDEEEAALVRMQLYRVFDFCDEFRAPDTLRVRVCSTASHSDLVTWPAVAGDRMHLRQAVLPHVLGDGVFPAPHSSGGRLAGLQGGRALGGSGVAPPVRLLWCGARARGGLGASAGAGHPLPSGGPLAAQSACSACVAHRPTLSHPKPSSPPPFRR